MTDNYALKLFKRNPTYLLNWNVSNRTVLLCTITKSECSLLPADCVWNTQAFATVHLLQLTALRIFILSLETEKCYFIGWLSLWREGCVASVTQPHLGLVILEES